MFSSWVVVAGTYGRQILLSAGVTKGMQIVLRAKPDPPERQNE